MNTEQIKNGVVRGMKAIDNWLADRLNYSGIEKREQRVYDRWRDEYEQFTDRELSSRYVNLQRKLRWKKQFTHPLLVLLCSAGIIGSTVLFGYALLQMILLYATENWTAFEVALTSRSVFLVTSCWAFAIFYTFAIALIGIVIWSHWTSFKELQTRLLVVEEIRADRRRNEVQDDEP